MPLVLGPLALALFQAGGPIWLANALVGVGVLGGVFSAVGQIALSFGLSFVAQKLFGPRTPNTKPEDVQQSIRAAASDRVCVYGQLQITGTWVFGDSKDGGFHKVLACCDSKLMSVLNFKIDDNTPTVDENGWVRSQPYGNETVSYCRFLYRTGLPVETYYNELETVFPEWDNTHRGDGVVSIYAYQAPIGPNDVARVFPSFKDTLYRIEGRFSEVYNFSTSHFEWSDNAANVIRDFFVSKRGMRIPEALVSTQLAIQAWQDACNRADRVMVLKTGGTEPAYRLWGAYRLSETPGSILATMMGNCDAQPILTRDGGLAIRIGDTPEPTVTLDNRLITAAVRISSGLDIRTTANRISSKFLSMNDSYQLVDADPWVNEPDILERGEIADAMDFGWSPSHSQARRLMKLRYHRLTSRWIMTINCRIGALAAFQEQFVNVDYTIGNYNISGVFEITDFVWNIDPETGILRSLTISMQSVASDMYAWNALTEEGIAPITPDLVIDRNIPGVTGLTATVARRIISGQSVAYAVLSFDAPTNPSLTLKLQGKKTAEALWQDINIPEGATTVDGLLMDDGVEYEFRAQYVSLAGKAGAWTDPTVKLVAIADNVAPGVVTDVNKTGGVGSVTLFWRTPNSANFSRVVIRRNTVNTFGTATTVGTVYGSPNVDYTVPDAGLTAGTYYYWITAVNGSNFPVDDPAQAVATGSVVVT